jgi:hypothetical protein
LLIMTLECGTTVFPASHAGKFRDISGVFPPTWAILLQREKTKLLSIYAHQKFLMRIRVHEDDGGKMRSWRLPALSA